MKSLTPVLRLFPLMLLCLILSGCGGAKTVLVHPGQPLQVLENRVMKGQTQDGTEVEQDVGGWIMMPPGHWEVIQRHLQQSLKQQMSPKKPGYDM